MHRHPDSSWWWTMQSIDGVVSRQSARTACKRELERLLRSRIADIDTPEFRRDVKEKQSVGRAWAPETLGVHPPRRGSMMNDQNMLTPAAIAGQVNRGGPI